MLWMSFQIRPCIAKHLSFLSCVRLGCYHSQNNVCWKLVTATVLFIKLGNWLPSYKSPWNARSGLGFRPILLKRNEIYFVTKFQLPLLQLLLMGSVTPKWQTKGLRFCNHTSLVIIQDSDLELGTQKYFQFSVYTPSWGSPMLHFDRKLSQS